MILNLDSNFKPLQENELDFEIFTFSAGEHHIKINPNFDVNQEIDVSVRINSFNDLGILILAVDALKRLNAKINRLIIPYFPGSRQDRIMQKGEPLTVKIYADLINSLNFKKVYIFDAHSDVTYSLINKCVNINNHLFIKNIISLIQEKEDLLIISPDFGASKKINQLADFLGGFEVVQCSKKRNTKTGKITDFEVFSKDLQNKNCLIIDDICDGGFTFLGLSDELKNKKANKIFLAVSHGIFSNGLNEFNKNFEHIFCTDSFKNIQNTKLLTQIKLNKKLLFD